MRVIPVPLSNPNASSQFHHMVVLPVVPSAFILRGVQTLGLQKLLVCHSCEAIPKLGSAFLFVFLAWGEWRLGAPPCTVSLPISVSSIIIHYTQPFYKVFGILFFVFLSTSLHRSHFTSRLLLGLVIFCIHLFLSALLPGVSLFEASPGYSLEVYLG
jgi:hypothetical protein